MTIEEAKAEIKQYMKLKDIHYVDGKLGDAFYTLLEQAPTPKESCDDCIWSECNYNKMVDCSKLLEEVSDKIEDYVCNEVKDHAKAQGMCDALTMIEDYFKENMSTPKESLVVEDAISRELVLNVLDAEAWEYIDYVKKDIGGNMDTHIAMFADNVRERINELPSVEPLTNTNEQDRGLT